MYSTGSGDARSTAAPNARDSGPSMPPDHPSGTVWDRQPFVGRDKFDRADRDRYSSTKKDWSLDNRSSSHRSASALFSNGSLQGPPSKRGALGRHGPIVENGRYGSAVGRSSESSSTLRSPSENGKAERDVCSLSGGPSPGYSGSPSTERLNKDLDGHHFRDSHLSPSDARPASSPRLEPSPRFDSSSRMYGSQNALEGLAPRERERSKFSSSPYAWDTPHRDRDFRERAWSRPEYHKRTCALPKLDSPRDWSLGDRELLEGRIDRYGSASSREPSFPDVLSANNKEHPRHDWRSRDRSLYSGLSSRTPTCPPTTISYLRDIGTPSARSEVSGVVSPPQLSPLQSSVSNESIRDDTGLTSPKKRPRLTWGQGLAKYEKEKTEEDPSTIKKPEEGSHQELHGGVCRDGLDASDYLNHSLQNGNVMPCQDNCRPCEEQLRITDGVQSDTQAVPYPPYENSMACSSLEESTREVSAHQYIDDFRKQSNSPESQQPLPEHVVPVTSALRPSILHDVQVFLDSYQRESRKVSKDVLTQHVEKVELEIDLVEKEIMKIDNEHGPHRLLSRKDEIDTTPDQIFCELASSAWNSPVMTSRFEPLDASVSAVQPQVPMQFMGSPALIVDPSEDLTVDKSVEGVPISHDVTVHLQEPLVELEATATDQVMCDIGEQGGCDSMEHSVLFAAQPVDGYLEAKGGYESVKFDQGIASTEESGDFIASLLWSNHVTAQQSLCTLAHLNGPGMETILQAGSLYGSPQEADIWKLNAESHERKLRYLESKVAAEKGNTKFAEGVLAVKYRAQRESWKQEHIGNYEGKERDKAFRLWEPDQRNSSLPSTHRTSSLRLRLITGSTMPDANSEEVQVARKLISQPPIENEREFLRMPSMFLGKKERALHRFVTKNALVEDPLAAEQERKAMNPWSAEEKKIFLDKYSVLGKNFSKISSFLEHKSVADCVGFYYRNQKTEEFEKVRRRHQLKKRRDSRSSALYLATTTSVSSRYREANAVYAEGLTLVAAAAAAAAAASVPRDFSRVFRSAATNSCPISSTSCKGFRERHLNKQASNSSSVAGKVGNEEQAGVKGARNMYSRSLKASHEEGDLQWTDRERELFMNAVTMFGKDFHSISLHIGTKNQGQCKSFFSKARKRLGLDQLVERHKAVLQGAMEQNENAAQQLEDMKAEPAINMEGDLSKQQHSFERSPPLVDIHPTCLASEVQCKTSQGNHDVEDVAAVRALKSLQEAGYSDGVLPGMSVCKPMQNVLDNPVKQEACSYFDSGDRVAGVSVNPQVTDTPLVDDVQGCVIEDSLVCVETLQFKTEATSVKTEPMVVSNLTNGVSNATPSLVPATALAVVVPALPPNAFPAGPVVQSTQVKDQSLKVMETKARREPTSWTQEEKEKFVDVLKSHGRNWDRLRESLPAKSLTQIKTYFQNSKAKLGLGLEGTVNGNGRVSSSRKRKADDSDSSSNAGSGGQTAPQKAPLHSDDGSLKVSPSMLVPPGGLGSNVLAAEVLAYANLFSRNSLEDSMNAQKVFQTMGLTPNSSTPGILPLFNSAIFAPPNMRPAQQSYIHPASMKTQQIANHQQPQQSLSPLVVVQPFQQPITSVGIHQAQQQQQPLARTHQDLSIPVQHLHKQPAQQQSQANQQALLQQQQQQQVVQQLQHQVAEAVLQEQLQPQHIQRQQQQQQQQQQQLQLAAQQVPHHHLQQVLSHHQGQVNQQVSSQAANQLSQGSSQAVGSQLATVSQSVAAGQQQQQQSGVFQSQLYQIHSKSQALLQKHQQTPQLQQLQLLQLQWQQQQQQQQSQVQQGQNQTPHLQQQSFALLNDQQQQLAILRGLMQASSGSAEASKQCDSDFQTLAKSQQGGCEDLHHPLVVSQATQAPNKSQAIPEVQLRAGDVKLFGQSLLSQPVSNNLQPSGKVSSASSPQGPFSAASTSFIVGKTSTDTFAQAPGDGFMQGPGWQQIVWPTAPFMNSGSSSTVASILQGSVATGIIGGGELEHHSVQEAVARMNERLIREARDMDDGRACDTSYSHMARVPDGRAFSSVLSSLDHGVISDPASLLSGQCGEIKRPENDSRRSDQLVNLDHGIAVNKSRGQELNQLSAAITGGQVVASQGLPRVLDALVALAEWRLQNSSGGSGRLTDEFLSQSWEALQRDPGSLVEAGKASGSLAQMYAGGSEMLQHLRDSLLYSQSHLMHLHPGAGGGVWAGSSGPVHLSDAQHAVSQSSSSFRAHNGVHHPARSDDAGMVEARDIDGSGGAIG